MELTDRKEIISFLRTCGEPIGERTGILGFQLRMSPKVVFAEYLALNSSLSQLLNALKAEIE
jgi:hypothetical protein